MCHVSIAPVQVHVRIMAPARHRVHARAHHNGKTRIFHAAVFCESIRYLIGSAQHVQHPSVFHLAKTMAYVRHRTVATGKNSTPFHENYQCCVSLTAPAHGLVVSVKHVRDTSIVLGHCSYFIVEFTAVCNPACLNGGNCTAPNTCICEL